jgi:hypothetical protein
MKTHDMKRVLKMATKLPSVTMEYDTERFDSWRKTGKLAGFKINRPPYAVGENYYRLAEIELTFNDGSVFWANSIERFSSNFIGFSGVRSEN